MYDTVYIMDSSNSYTQFRFNNNTNSVQNNLIYTLSGKFISDYSANPSLNTIANNTVIKGIGTPTPISTDVTKDTTTVPVPDTTYVDPTTTPVAKTHGKKKK